MTSQLPNSLDSVPLARPAWRLPIEQAVTTYLGRAWKVTNATDMVDFASHPCAILSDGDYPVFAKFSAAANALDQFEVELARMQMVATRANVLTPAPIGVVPAESGHILVMQAVQAVERTPQRWRQIGQALAQLHQHTGAYFGLDSHGYFGPVYQDNSPMSDWPTFYAERRLRPALKLAVEAGTLSPALIQQVEAIIARLPELCGLTVAPVLLHGDAQQNNFISTANGAVMIDLAASYYGHPEFDLACVDYFEPVPADLLDGYREVLPIDAGFAERRDLWRLWNHLAVVAVAGADYLKPLVEAVQKYI